MQLNEPLLRKVYEHITQHPLEWEQEVWSATEPDEDAEAHTFMVKQGTATYPVVATVQEPSCGTTACFAGWAVILGDSAAKLLVKPTCGIADEVLLGDGTVSRIDEAARESLGLTRDQAAKLFNGSNDIDDIEAVIDGSHHRTEMLRLPTNRVGWVNDKESDMTKLRIAAGLAVAGVITFGAVSLAGAGRHSGWVHTVE